MTQYHMNGVDRIVLQKKQKWVVLLLKNILNLQRCGRKMTDSLNSRLGAGMSRGVWEICLKSRGHVRSIGIKLGSEPDSLCQASPPHPPTLFILALLSSLSIRSSSLNLHDSCFLFSFRIFVTFLPHPEFIHPVLPARMISMPQPHWFLLLCTANILYKIGPRHVCLGLSST